MLKFAGRRREVGMVDGSAGGDVADERPGHVVEVHRRELTAASDLMWLPMTIARRPTSQTVALPSRRKDRRREVRAVVVIERDPFEADEEPVVELEFAQLDQRGAAVADELVAVHLNGEAEGQFVVALRELEEPAHDEGAVLALRVARADVRIGDEIALDARLEHQIADDAVVGVGRRLLAAVAAGVHDLVRRDMRLAGNGEAANREGDVGHGDGAPHQTIFDDIEPRRGSDGKDAPETDLVEPVAGDLRACLLEKRDARRPTRQSFDAIRFCRPLLRKTAASEPPMRLPEICEASDPRAENRKAERTQVLR